MSGSWLRVLVGIALPLVGLWLPPASAPAAPTKEQAAFLAAPPADVITTEFLVPAVRQAVANGVATLVARITAEGNDHGLAFPPRQTVQLLEMVEVPARRMQYEQPVYEHEWANVEKIVPVMQSGQPTGRFEKIKQRVIVKSRQVGKKTMERFVRDPAGTEKMKVGKYGPGGPAVWGAILPGLNGMALHILAKAGLAKHPATVRHAEALAAHVGECGMPDNTFDVAWMAAGFASLGDDSRHADLARRLLGKLVDGQVRQKGEVDGLWGPVCVNYAYYGKLFTLGQTLRQELDVAIPKKLEQAPPGQQEQIIKLGREMKQVYDAYEQTYRDVFRCGTRMLEIRSPFAMEDKNVVPGMPLNAYQWVVTDIESTEAAACALAEAKRAGLLPTETQRLAIRSKKIHPPMKTDAAIRAAAKRIAAAVDAGGGTTALAILAANTGFEKTGYPAPAFTGNETPRLFDLETACTCLAADAAIESLVAAEPDLADQLDEPRKRAHERAAQIAARWYAESANPAADAWKGMYSSWKVSHEDLKRSPILPVPDVGGGDVDSLPWGPAGCLYRIVPGFRSLFAAAGSAQERFGDDLFRRVAYRLVALQDTSGQWSSPGNTLLSTASESLLIDRVARRWHGMLDRDPPLKLGVPDPVPYETMLITDSERYGGWVSINAERQDAAAYPTLASLLFLADGIDGDVSLDGIQILPDEPPEPSKEKEPDADGQPPRLKPSDAARKVVRPSLPREELFAAIIESRWPRKTAAAEPAAAGRPAAAKPASKAEEKPKEEPAEDDGLGKFEDLLTPEDAKK